TLKVGELDYLGLAFHDLAVKLIAGDTTTRIEVGGPNVAGSISMPVGGVAPWLLEFERLQFDVAENVAPAGPERDAFSPRSVPALEFHATQLVWGERHLGDV